MKLPIADCQPRLRRKLRRGELPIVRATLTVAQTGSLQYRRLATCGGRIPADCQSAIQQVDNLRYDKQKRRAAFTLIEIMVAIMVFSMVIASIYATWALVIRATQIGQDAAAQAQRQRVVLRAIGDALMGVESFQASQNYYWFKLGNGDTPFLSFVARLPDTFPRHNKFVGGPDRPDMNSRRVTFSLAAGADGEKDLILQQSPILMDMDDDEKQYPLILARNVREFTVEWWGTNELNKADWNTEWDDTMTNTIPQMLRVHLVLGANTAKGSEAPVFAATHIYTVPSQMMPTIVQRGIGGPAGGGGAPPPPAPNPNQPGTASGIAPPGGNPNVGKPY